MGLFCGGVFFELLDGSAELRPLGILTYEDKLLQCAMTDVLSVLHVLLQSLG